MFDEERVPVTMYNVVKDDKYCGGVNVGLKFTHQVSTTLNLIICFLWSFTVHKGPKILNNMIFYEEDFWFMSDHDAFLVAGNER